MSRLRHALGRVFQLLLAAVYGDRAGRGEDISFDVALNAKFRMRVLCVDPTPRAIAHVAGLLDAAASGRAYAVEGGAERYVLEGFDAGRFDAIPAALWGQDASLRLYAPQDPAHVSHSALNLQHTIEHIDVPARRMSTLPAERGTDRRVRRLRAAGYALVATERANFVFARLAALAEPA